MKKMQNLENGRSKVPIALDALVASSRVTVQGGRTDIHGQIAPVFPEYIAPAPAASYATPVPTAFAAPAPVVERISPDFIVYAVPGLVAESLPTAFVAAPVVENISPDPTVCAAPAPVVEFIAPAPVASNSAPAPVVEYISSDPAVYAAPASIVEYMAPATAGYAGPVAAAAVPRSVLQYLRSGQVTPLARCFCSSALRTLFCDRWSMTLTGDTMSSVARDVAAGAVKRRRESVDTAVLGGMSSWLSKWQH